MNSSVLELKEALIRLTDYNQRWNRDWTSGADADGFVRIYQACNALASKFDGANETLQEGWQTSADLFYRLHTAISDTLGEMYEDINKFTDESYQAELAAADAVKAASDAAQKIIADLGL